MEMSFPEDYPMAPPFVRVIRPKFRFLTGHVTIGGSICMQVLTKSGWSPGNDIEVSWIFLIVGSSLNHQLYIFYIYFIIQM